MEILRYQAIRTELIATLNRFKSKGFRMHVPEHVFMSTKELEEQEIMVKPGFLAMGDPLSDTSPRLITTEQLMNIIPKLNAETHIGFVHPEDAVEIYEDIESYLKLWMEVANQAPQFPIPDIAELYCLEDLMVWLFKIYKPLVYLEHYNRMKKVDVDIARADNALSTWVSLAGGLGPGDVKPTFVSVLNTQLPSRLKAHYDMVVKRDAKDWLFDDDFLRG